jgi:hypothetical protein
MAAYLRVIDEDGEYRGALLIVNSIGEPVEFCHAEISPPTSALWRESDVRRRCAGALTRALFEACSSQPRIVLGLASELDPAIFRSDVNPVIAACRVVPGDPSQTDEGEIATAQGPRLIWAAEKPAADSPERQLLNRLIDHDLLVEPFERAVAGLSEATSATRDAP